MVAPDATRLLEPQRNCRHPARHLPCASAHCTGQEEWSHWNFAALCVAFEIRKKLSGCLAIVAKLAFE